MAIEPNSISSRNLTEVGGFMPRVVNSRYEETGQLNSFGSPVNRSTSKLLTRPQEIWLAQQMEIGKLASDSLTERTWGDNIHPLAEIRVESLLAKLSRNGEDAYNTFYHSNLRMVGAIGRNLSRTTGMNVEDATQEGNIALIRAVRAFDWRRGFRFSTLAFRITRNEMLRHREDNTDQIGERTSRKTSSLYAVRVGTEDLTLEDSIPDPVQNSDEILDKSVDFQFRVRINHLLDTRWPTAAERQRNKSLFWDYYDRVSPSVEERVTYTAVGNRHGVSGSEASNIIRSILNELREDPIIHAYWESTHDGGKQNSDLQFQSHQPALNGRVKSDLEYILTPETAALIPFAPKVGLRVAIPTDMDDVEASQLISKVRAEADLERRAGKWADAAQLDALTQKLRLNDTAQSSGLKYE